ncbi:MAG: diguanylate cyclase, partial [Ilumatobacteraceae bacterium]
MKSGTEANGARSSAQAMRSAAFDRLGACAVVIDSDGVIVDTNQAWRLFAHLNDGPSDTTGVGINYLDVCDRASAAGIIAGAGVAAGLRQILSGERERMEVEYPCPSPTEDRWFLMQASALPVSDGAGAVVFHVDVTAQKQLIGRLDVLAHHDALTGLPNRRAALRYLERQLRLGRDSDEAVWALFVDIDEFKAVNDTYGHHVGDELLAKVGIRARRALRESDHLCRIGGDEFVVICAGLDRDRAIGLADRLRAVMAAPFQIGELQVVGRVSVGVAESDAASTAESMLRAADEAMYVDKRGAHASALAVEVPTPHPSYLTDGLLPARTVTFDHGSAGWQSSERNRAAAALTNSNDLILFFAADGTIEWASSACTQLLGVRPEEIVG